MSRLTKNTDPSELKKIHEVATVYNKKNNITGMLVFGNDYFMQCLEGGNEIVNELYIKISADQRHEQTVLLSYEDISEREFDHWAMKLVLLTPEKIKFLRRFSVTDGFEPYSLSASSALKIMLELKSA